MFEQVLKRCMDEGLISGEGIAVDASVVKADASKQRHHDDHMKRILKVDRIRLRGLSGAVDECLLTARAQNLRRMARMLGTGSPEEREMAIA